MTITYQTRIRCTIIFEASLENRLEEKTFKNLGSKRIKVTKQTNETKTSPSTTALHSQRKEKIVCFPEPIQNPVSRHPLFHPSPCAFTPMREDCCPKNPKSLRVPKIKVRTIQPTKDQGDVPTITATRRPRDNRRSGKGPRHEAGCIPDRGSDADTAPALVEAQGSQDDVDRPGQTLGEQEACAGRQATAASRG